MDEKFGGRSAGRNSAGLEAVTTLVKTLSRKLVLIECLVRRVRRAPQFQHAKHQPLRAPVHSPSCASHAQHSLFLCECGLVVFPGVPYGRKLAVALHDALPHPLLLPFRTGLAGVHFPLSLHLLVSLCALIFSSPNVSHVSCLSSRSCSKLSMRRSECMPIVIFAFFTLSLCLQPRALASVFPSHPQP